MADGKKKPVGSEYEKDEKQAELRKLAGALESFFPGSNKK